MTAPGLLLTSMIAATVAPGPGGPQEPPAATVPPPLRYRCVRAAGPVTIDGRPNESAWRGAGWTEPFGDIRGAAGPRPRHRTRAKMLWDDEHLYVAARLDEPHVWATLTEHDQIVFHDNDFEVFLDPDGDARSYAEIEVNALATVFDLLLEKPYFEGGPARHEWNVAGLRIAVHVDGTLNDPSDTDRGWSVEMAIPFAALAPHCTSGCPPRAGDVWRANFSRVQWRHEVVDGAYRKVPDTREDNWSWSPQHEVNMHKPRRWGFVEFVGAE